MVQVRSKHHQTAKVLPQHQAHLLQKVVALLQVRAQAPSVPAPCQAATLALRRPWEEGPVENQLEQVVQLACHPLLLPAPHLLLRHL